MPTPHGDRPRLTEFEKKFSDAWPSVAPAVVAQLKRRGIPADWAEDVTQEAGLRVLDREIQFTSSDDLLPWVLVVARRLALNRLRDDRLVVDGREMERTGASSEETVHARLALAAVAAEIRTLTPSDRELLFDHSVQPGPDRGRRYVRRHRLRQRLAKVAGAFLSGGAVVGASRDRRGVLTAATAVGSVLVVAGWSIGPAAIPDRRRPPSSRLIVEALAPPAAGHRSVQPAVASDAALSVTPAVDSTPRPGAGPVVAIEVATPNGDRFLLGARDKRPDDAFVCVAPASDPTCVDSPDPPVPWTAVDVPVPVPEPAASALPSD